AWGGLRRGEPGRIACSIYSKVKRRSSPCAALRARNVAARRNRSGNRQAARAGRISAAPTRPALCDRETTPSSTGTPYGITTRKDGRLSKTSRVADAESTRPAGASLRGGASLDLLDQLHLRAVGRGDPTRAGRC